jgi:hypothetical protein
MKTAIWLSCYALATSQLVAGTIARISLSEGAGWSIDINKDGSARLYFGSGPEILYAAKGSLNLEKMESTLGPLSAVDPGLVPKVSVYISKEGVPDPDAFSHPQDVKSAQKVFREVFEKLKVLPRDVQVFTEIIKDHPPMGLQDLELQEGQIDTVGYYGPPIHLQKRKPKSMLPEWKAVTQRFPMLGEISSVAALMFSTPWPYLALLILLGMVVRRYRLKSRRMVREPVS